MGEFSKISAALVASTVLVASACGASSKAGSNDADAGGGSAGTGQGGASGGTGGTQGGASGTGTGGSGVGGTVAGTGGCGPCLRIACAPPVWLTIVPNVDAGAAMIADLTVDVPGLTLQCNSNASATSCQWSCQALALVPSGHYSATISAPGFEPQTVEFDIANPTSCGCCGCGCGGSFQATVALHPSGGAGAGCCAALDRDPSNCGACGKVCPIASCRDGKCAPEFGSCIAGGLGFSSCDAYCESLGLACTASCGSASDQAMLEWVGGVANCGADPNVTPRAGTCSETLANSGVDGGRADYQCCCGER